MSIRVMTQVWDCSFPSLPAKMIALKLADCANDDGENIFPSIGTVERASGCSRSTVCKWIAALEHSGLLIVVERSQGGSKRDTTVRAFDMAKLRELANGDTTLREVRLENGKQVFEIVPATDETRPCDGPLDGDPSVPRTPTRPSGGPLPVRAADPPVRAADPPVRAADPPVRAADPNRKEPSDNRHTHTATTEPESRVCEKEQLLIELKKAGGNADAAVDGFIAPLIGALRWPPGIEDRLAFLRGMRDALKALPPAVLARAVTLTLAERTVWPSVAQALKIANRAGVDVPLIKIKRPSPAFDAWISHYRAKRQPWMVSECDNRGFVLERSEFPPVVEATV